VIDRADRWIVAFKIAILLVFVAIGLWSVEPKKLMPREWAAPVQIVAANCLELSSIAKIGSAGFLLIFAAVNVANVVLARQTDSMVCISGLGALACTGALFAFLWQIEIEAPLKILVLVAILGTSVGIESLYRFLRRPSGRR
jgi:hypothetical protein